MTRRRVTIYNENMALIKDTRKNAKYFPVTVMKPIPGDWQMLSESHPHKKTASNTAVWLADVPANGKAQMVYKVRVRY